MKKLLVTLGVAALVLPSAAMAESEFSIVLQGGAAKYNQSLSGSDVGAAYGARLGILPTPMLGIEVGYLGSQNNINQSLNQFSSTKGLRVRNRSDQRANAQDAAKTLAGLLLYLRER